MGVLKYKNSEGEWVSQAIVVQADDTLSTESYKPVQNRIVTAALNSKADASAVYTKSEVDSKDTSTLNSAKSYADTKASAAETNAKSYADTKDTETLNTAKSYTDTKTSEISGNTYTKSEVDGKLSEKQGKLTAGENITISDDNVISASGGSGSSDLIVNITYTPSTTEGEIGTFSADKTFDELVEVYNTGTPIWIKGNKAIQSNGDDESTTEVIDFNYLLPLTGYGGETMEFSASYYASGEALFIGVISKNFVTVAGVFNDYYAGTALDFNYDDREFNVKYDNNTIKLNENNELYAVGGSSEDNIYLVNFSMSGENWVADKTFENILAAANANKTVIGKAIGMGDLDAQLVLSGFDSTLIQFDVTFVTSSIVEIIGLTMDPSNVITVIDFGISPPLGEGKAIDISDGEINVKYDDSTIKLDSDGKLYAVGGSGGAVSSVNGKTGTVVLKTSDIENDSNYVTAAHHDSSKVDTSLLGAINGVATLNSQGKVLDSQLPDYMDDVVEGYYFNSKFYKDASHTEEIAGTSGKLYLDTVTSKLYRYSGSSYTEISGGSGASYSAGNGINIADNTISAKVDNNTIKVNSSGQLYTEESGSIATDSYHTTTTFGNDIPMDITFTKYGKVIDLTIQAVSPFYMKVIEKEGIPTWTNNKYKGEYITAGRDGAVVPWEIYTASDATIAYALYPFADGTTGHIRGLYKEPSKFTESSGVITKEEAVIYDEINHVYWTRTWTYTSGVKPDTFTDGSTKSFTYNKTPGSYVGTNQYGLFVDDIVEVPDWAHPATSNATVQGKHLIFNQFDGERELQVGLLTDNASVTCVHKFYMTLGYDTYNETFADDGTPIHTPLETPKVRLCGSYIRGITMDSTDMETINMMRTDLYKDMTFHITYIAQ